MVLKIRKKDSYINFIHNIQELRDFRDNYIPHSKILIGDISMFNKNMLNILLKFLEENPSVDCYSSKDITDPVLISRFTKVEKEQIRLDYHPSTQDFIDSSRDYNAIGTFLPHIKYEYQLRMLHAPNFLIEILTSL